VKVGFATSSCNFFFLIEGVSQWMCECVCDLNMLCYMHPSQNGLKRASFLNIRMRR
jgi:hypothetical protein